MPLASQTAGQVVDLAPFFKASGKVMDFLPLSDVFATFEVSTLSSVARTQLRGFASRAGQTAKK